MDSDTVFHSALTAASSSGTLPGAGAKLEDIFGRKASEYDPIGGESARVIVRSGAQRLAFCRDEGWRYCGWLEHVDALKVRVSRDLDVVKENAEIFRKGG